MSPLETAPTSNPMSSESLCTPKSMGLFKKQNTNVVFEPTTPGRPEGTHGDTGLRFRGWYTTASVTLSHAASDDDPRCVRVLCKEAKIGCDEADREAKNDRQKEMVNALRVAVDKVDRIARNTPAL